MSGLLTLIALGFSLSVDAFAADFGRQQNSRPIRRFEPFDDVVLGLTALAGHDDVGKTIVIQTFF